MFPLRLVIDTNVLISAALKPEGLQRAVMLLAITRPARLYVSRPILAEYRTVLGRPELRIRKGLRQQLLQLIKNHSHTVVPTRDLEVTSDPDDNIFLECGGGGLLSDGQSEAFSEVLEEDQGCYVSRIH